MMELMDVLLVIAIIVAIFVITWIVFVNIPNRRRLTELEAQRTEILETDLAMAQSDIADVKLVEAALLSQLLGRIIGANANPSTEETSEIIDFRHNLRYRYLVLEEYIDKNITEGTVQNRSVKEIATSLWLNSFDSSKLEAGSEHPWIDFHMKNLLFVLDMIGFYVFASGTKMDEKEMAFIEIARVFKWTEKDLQQSLYNWRNRQRI
ncbi:MAG: hypothetical protein OXG24_01805 [Gammaproteobacteria bacterium]|nr:hypothetical protein [Gammaproteobacteria bacterium]